MLIAILAVQAVILVVVVGGLKYIQVLARGLKGMLTNPEIRYHLGKVVDPRLVRERRQSFLKESRK